MRPCMKIDELADVMGMTEGCFERHQQGHLPGANLPPRQGACR